jgi:excisionase family DNA binding protein
MSIPWPTRRMVSLLDTHAEVVSIMNQLPAHDDARKVAEKVSAAFSLTTRRYFRVDEVARYFAVSDRTIYRLIDMGDLKVIRLRDCIRISAEEIRSLEERQSADF